MKDLPENLGPGGVCICPGCGFKTDKQRGLPCREMTCPDCGRKLLREDGEHYRKVLEARAKKESGRKSEE